MCGIFICYMIAAFHADAAYITLDTIFFTANACGPDIAINLDSFSLTVEFYGRSSINLNLLRILHF